jgi:hypothetical protein
MCLKLKIILTSLLFMSSLWAGGTICEFHATRQEGTVLLEWATESEESLAKFEIFRSNDQSIWIKIGEQTASGKSSSKRYYTYIDNSIFKTFEANFYYKLVLVDQSGQRTTYPTTASVSGSSGFRHTWGSIKAMFR